MNGEKTFFLFLTSTKECKCNIECQVELMGHGISSIIIGEKLYYVVIAMQCNFRIFTQYIKLCLLTCIHTQWSIHGFFCNGTLTREHDPMICIAGEGEAGEKI